jgi:geranylgeranylglycerol-phosphate geranylgeranyltransferase
MFVRKFISHIIILRPINVLISGISIIIASKIIQPDNSIILVSTLALIVMLFTSGANTLNDFIDYKIDLINRPSRPIPIGDVKK